MRVLVLGAGGVGGYYGARLLEAGHEVAFLVRPARAERLRKNGLCVIRHAQDTFARTVDVVTVVAPDSRYELVMLSCKAYDLDTAIAAIAPAVGADTRVLPLLNGLRHLDALDAAFGAIHVLGGLCHISLMLDDEGVIRQFGAMNHLAFGTRDRAQPVPAAIGAGLRGLGANVVESPDIMQAMWEKLVFIAALAGLTCLLRGSVGEIVSTPEGTLLARRLYDECARIAERSGHAPRDAARADAQRTLTMAASPMKASMLRDLERGARTEGEHILGDMRERARAHAVDTPLLSAALAHVRVYEASRAG
ncbi:MAG: ketopantoate reductase family protein [Rhodanobacter sp.]|jgi:2-dehydropantoate 2-reductase|nr:ketopantoate reductase family protein [Rhodanobacter sp.]